MASSLDSGFTTLLWSFSLAGCIEQSMRSTVSEPVLDFERVRRDLREPGREHHKALLLQALRQRLVRQSAASRQDFVDALLGSHVFGINSPESTLV